MILMSEFPCTHLLARCSDFNTSESPYPEVRASVSSIDDPSMPVNTFRVYVFTLFVWLELTLFLSWFLGMFFVLATSGLNEIFGLRCGYLSFLYWFYKLNHD